MLNRLTDRALIRERLNLDREWSLYALADLEDSLFPLCDWYTLPGEDSLALVFRGISITPIVVWGPARGLLSAIPVSRGYLNLQCAQEPAAAGLWRFGERHVMHRMFLEDFQPAPAASEILTSVHLQEIGRLYATGTGGGIAFAPAQLETGFFRGIRRGGELVAVAGVHVVSHAESVAAVGNIFTRPDCRGQGLARAVTSAAVSALLESGIRTVGLNVETNNLPAIRSYTRLGFRTHLTYVEGPAARTVS